MIKTQVQIPDELFHRAKRLAEEKEWSFAEVVRRGLEQIAQSNPPHRTAGKDWRLPEGLDMGLPLLPGEEWTAVCRDEILPAQP